MISFREFKGFYFTLEADMPIYMFCQIVDYRKKGEIVMFQGNDRGSYLYC